MTAARSAGLLARSLSRSLRLLVAWALLGVAPAAAQEGDTLYRFPADQQTRWASPENPTAAPGAGARENRGGKGHAFETIPVGQSLTLANIQGAGIIDRIWMTIEDRSPEALRGLKLEMYWDGAATPAVSVPLGDFFLHGAGEMRAMETALLSSPEGRSFVSIIPMPFRRSARLVVTNEGPRQVNLIFYDVNFRTLARQPADMLYFHAWWSRDRATALGRDFRVLPRIEGRGRFLGASFTVLTNPIYRETWWGEGEIKIFLDRDRSLPTLAGTGAEDYIGTAWGQGAYINRYQGAPIAEWANDGRWTFYRFHIPDPVLFRQGIEVTLQQMGGARNNIVLAMQRAGVPLIPVTIDPGSRVNFQQLLDRPNQPVDLADPTLPDGHTNFYRSDDVAAVAYFYLDRPVAALPPIAAGPERMQALRKPPAPPPAAPVQQNSPPPQ